MIKELKLIYNSVLPFGKQNTDMALWPVIFTKRELVRENDVILNHERIHLRQQVEVTVAALLLLAAVILIAGWSWWWLAAAPLAFPLWYAVEWLVKWPMTSGSYNHIRAVSFEQEAYSNERDWQYNDDSHWFGWVRYVFRTY